MTPDMNRRGFLGGILARFTNVIVAGRIDDLGRISEDEGLTWVERPVAVVDAEQAPEWSFGPSAIC